MGGFGMDQTKPLADQIREATDPSLMPYGVFGIMGNPYIGKVPDDNGNSGDRKPHRKQGLFLSNKYNAIFDGFYGGAAGGAKSDAILMAALQFVMVPTYRALIVRKTYKMLSKSGALMERANTWLAGTDAKWNGQDHVWTFPSGARLEFGHLEHAKNVADYQSANFHFIGIDEVTDLDEDTVEMLISRIRSDKADGFIPLRFRAASNPIGPGVGWVKRRYVTPVKDRTKASIFQVQSDGELHTRFFIPASLKDNPYINRSEYERVLRRMNPVKRAQLLDGNWDAKQSGSVFDTSYLETVPDRIIPHSRLRKVRYWDLAGTDAKDNPNASNTVGLLYGVDPITGYDYVLDLKKFKLNTTETEATVRQVAAEDGVDVEVWLEQEPGQSGKAQVVALAGVLDSHTVRGDLPGKRGSKEVRAKPVATKIGRGRVRVREGAWNEEFFIDLSSFPDKQAQDTVDTLSGAHAVTRNAKGMKKTNTRTGSSRVSRKPIIKVRGKTI